MFLFKKRSVVDFLGLNYIQFKRDEFSIPISYPNTSYYVQNQVPVENWEKEARRLQVELDSINTKQIYKKQTVFD